MRTFLFLFILVLSFNVQAQTADEIVKKYIEFKGGSKQLKKMKTLITSGEYDYGGIVFPFTAYAKAPNLYKFIVPFNGKYYAQAYDGNKGWKIDAFKNESTPTLLNGKPAVAMANEADVELEDVFINYHTKGHRIILEGQDTILEKLTFKLKLIRKDSTVEVCYFETTTYALVMKSGVSKNVELEGAILQTFYSDYRDIEGIKIPFKTICKSNGQMVLTITVSKASLNGLIDDKEFQP